MEQNATELANELIQFIDRNGLRNQFLQEQTERGFDEDEIITTIEWVEDNS